MCLQYDPGLHDMEIVNTRLVNARKSLSQKVSLLLVVTFQTDPVVWPHHCFKETPDILLNELVLNALSKWAFRPAQLDGKPAAVKVLVGVPVSLPE